MGKRTGATKGAAKGGKSKNAATQQAKREEAFAAWKKRQKSSVAAQQEESEFTRLDAATLERLNLHATYDTFPRPVPGRVTVFEHEGYEYEFGSPEDQQAAVVSESTPSTLSRRQQQQRLLPRLQLPKKPKWNRDMSVKAVQSNEKEAFRSWLEQTDRVVTQFFAHSQEEKDQEEVEEEQKAREGASVFLNALNRRRSNDDSDEASPPTESSERQAAAAQARRLAAQDPYRARIPSQFERNLFVYQQLWRVVDRSHILLVLMDVRAAQLHLPPSLQAYLQRRAHNRVRRTVLVLTKTDLVTPAITQEWIEYLRRKYPQWTVVQTSSYIQLEPLEGQGQRVRSQPFISDDSHARLIDAIEREYVTLMEQPAGKESQDLPALGRVDFDRLRRGEVTDQDLGSGAPDAPDDADAPDAHRDTHPRSQKTTGSTKAEGVSALPADLVIGCIGQPNVGKSSLINALLGARRVHASKTPGKTKHYQTHVLSSRPPRHRSGEGLLSESESELRAGDPAYSRVVLCDSPGLVFPMFAGLEMQVLAGVYNVAHVQAASACVAFAGQRMPLEQLYRLAGPVEDSDTLRGMRTRKADGKTAGDRGSTPWTAGLFLESIAQARGFRTAKAARLDTNRAANWVLRALAEGRIHWAFRPAHADGMPRRATDDGIWLRELDVGVNVDATANGGHEEEEEEEEGEEKEVHMEQSARSSGRSPKEHGRSIGKGRERRGFSPGPDSAQPQEKDEAEAEAEAEAESVSSGSEADEGARKPSTTASRFAALQLDDGDEEA